jgi:hypothetical protein
MNEQSNLSRRSTALWHGKGCFVPKDIAVCPECGSELSARAMAWDSETGQPHAESIEIDCQYDADGEHWHRWHQSDWQRVRDAITKWSKAHQEYGR